ncbi:glycosyltransferase family 1 protein [Formosa sp. PL04]|uniref:glycosyltransferase family 4 protein n=1 Tax=Formosa sp. PL04 TaxID=3081755 RepID=UPI002981F563|nr:glycosyltransferase family 1 protein [Formosa sp. PL04]MDW5287866.1 glycosyltransferase family 1 protein [Formosa sp. PL04]
MFLKINYIFRKRLPQYNSIEELFGAIQTRLKNKVSVETQELYFSGGSPIVILKNLLSFKNKPINQVNHITGDVNYMAFVTGNKSVLTIHDIGSILKGNILKRTYLKLVWFTLPALFVKRITVISEFTKEELSKIVPFATHKIKVVYNPVHSRLTYCPKKKESVCPNILLIGTKPNKNIERTFEALNGISCKLTIIGKLTQAQLALLQTYKLEYKTMFQIPYNDIVEAYKSSDLVLFASTYEGFGMPIIEAQAVGRPVITSNIGAMKEVAANSAYLVDPYNVDEIRKGVKDILSDESVQNELIRKGQENVKRFHIDKIAEDYLTIYNEVANA